MDRFPSGWLRLGLLLLVGWIGNSRLAGDQSVFTASLFEPPTSFRYYLNLPFRLDYTTATFTAVTRGTEVQTWAELREETISTGLRLETNEPLILSGTDFYLCSAADRGASPCLFDAGCTAEEERFCPVSYSVEIIPLLRPTVLQQPRPAIRVPGDFAFFDTFASASDGGSLSYQWYRESGEIPGANDSVLVIPQVGLDDYGWYWCEVEDSNGVSRSAVVGLYPPQDTDADGLDDRIERKTLQYRLVPAADLTREAMAQHAAALGFRLAQPAARDRTELLADLGVEGLPQAQVIILRGQFYSSRHDGMGRFAPWGFDDRGEPDTPNWAAGEPNDWLGLDEKFLSLYGIGIADGRLVGAYNDIAADPTQLPYPDSWELFGLWIALGAEEAWTDWNVPDSDADGLLDGAEVLTHGTRPDRLDTDGDGYADPLEIAEGSDPLVAEDAPGLGPVIDLEAATFAFNTQVFASLVQTYQIQHSTNLVDWQPAATPEGTIIGDGFRHEVALTSILGQPLPPSPLFLRIEIRPESL